MWGAYLVIPVALAVALQRGERERERGVSVPQAGWLLVGEKVRVWAGGREGQRWRLGQKPHPDLGPQIWDGAVQELGGIWGPLASSGSELH